MKNKVRGKIVMRKEKRENKALVFEEMRVCNRGKH